MLLKVYYNDFPFVVIARSSIRRQISLFAMHNAVDTAYLAKHNKKNRIGIVEVKRLYEKSMPNQKTRKHRVFYDIIFASHIDQRTK